jgi:hypothetical protein
MNHFAAGLLSGVALAVVFAVYIFIRKSALIRGFKAVDPSIDNIADQTLFFLILGAFSTAAVLMGVVAGYAHLLLGLPLYYYVAFGAAILLSLVAVITSTPLKWDKVFWNLATGVVLGVLVPMLDA